ncbi:MAG: 1-acyl-sn-glycerol-3-phosphate acyltransferase [Actinomycetota bacterium]|nr:1-acyl-sn-glycerol-3-phosphate acyltransferase [Actinomycetota bacterium]
MSARREPVWWVSIRVLDAFVRLALRLRVTGLEHLPATGPGIVVANHVSYLDPVVLVVLAHRRGGRKMRFLGVQEAFERPVTGWFIRAGRHIPVGAASERALAIRQARDALGRGDLVLVYPEGTIPDEPLSTAKGGAGLLALTSHVPVIPVATTGLERRRGGWLRQVRRRRASVAVGRPVSLDGAAGVTGRRRYEAASDLMMAAIHDLG